MNREQVEHVLRASAVIANETSFVVIGSQAVLFPFPDAPASLLVSRELDLYPALHPERSDLIDGAIGAMSSFHETFGYYADGVGPETAVMPADWMSRAMASSAPGIGTHSSGDLTKSSRSSLMVPSRSRMMSFMGWCWLRRRGGGPRR